eukprot:TRINITY_DN508_c0_g1::TRINITY_DN508_c0_g1_i1::g.10588::m.10588 TRINITY_DN508_c0_g1::TRINITY_DN508_c0_g1_i1::g.10588  ORF type:complete len:140 (+),score=5.49,sp/Q2QLB3/CTTB2_PLEMO/40.34/3e-20,Ank_2/PF12796.2/1.2e-22,Ank_2/PF12796.2/0.033,Ank/PF00023.25/34,Ank/PF00023.25/8.2e-08,Ank/PF00023.25/7.8e-08,Ank/PF00023.25/0.051,Ank_4/PF13637.1/3e-06,Ank_4/PF13637.1/2.9e-09,Ank_4/PF13637.1/0.00017,Ank_5/PF13857.1/35,Ank_5/PF13857.1/2.3e-06,Ank_5/PF13857.1/1.2e-11,Ank_3/PF13606.1/14,Ank_3/PF13606.1/9.2e-0
MELIAAAAHGDLTTVKKLIEDEMIDVDLCDLSDRTPLMGAARNGHSQIVAYLLSKDAKINAKDVDHFTALAYAAFNGHAECVHVLLQYGADYTIHTFSGETPLQIALAQGHKTCAKLLKQAEAADQGNLLLITRKLISQ